MKALRPFLAALTVAAASGASTPHPGSPAATSSTAADIGRLLANLTREEQHAVRRFAELGELAERAELRALARGRAYVRLARAGLLPIGSGFAAFVEHAARLERLRRGLEKDLDEQQRSHKERIALGTRIEELRARRAPLEVEHAALQRAETELRSAEEREQAFARAFLGTSSNDHTAIYGAVGPGAPAGLDARFVAQRGRLPIPVAGRCEITPEKRAASSGPGLALRTRAGTEVRTVHAGRVAFADTVADYGKAVIIDHGDGYYSLSGNLGAIEVAAGDELDRGARIGTVAEAPGGARLYFEIRNGTQTVDVAGWLGL
jgi:septal ring factor EnvC (AmiA/AmiB activator)